MFCDVCKTKEATVFLTQMIEGKVEKLNLCELCSKLQGVHDPMGFALADLLLGLGAAHQIEKTSLSCAVCGFSQSDFKKRGRLGCSACYDTFEEGLAVMLRNMHRGLIHTGKMPAKKEAAYKKASQLVRLQESLARAINKEEYEEAARYRDLLRHMELESREDAEKEHAYLQSAEKVLSPEEKVPPKKKARKKSPPLPPPETEAPFLL